MPFIARLAMKKIIITTSLKIIPKNLQNKALCKALNYLFSTVEMTEVKDSIIKLNISDIKKSWFVTYGENGFEAVKLRKVNLEIKTKLNIAMAFDNKIVITDALK
jgi:predicted lipid carrier protein YhbT